MTGWTQAEPEWDDAERDRLLALAIYEAGVCSGCGFHHDLTGDRANHFTFEDRVCQLCRGSERYKRIQAKSDEQAVQALGKNPAPSAVRPADGRTTFLRLMGEDEVERLRSPSRAGATSGEQGPTRRRPR